jgi:uncharacterized membrane protein YdjX (TVP38/TMEM64 family)
VTRKRIVWLVAGAGIVVVLLLLGRRAAGYIPAFAGWVESLGALGPIAFMAGYILATVAMVPGLLLTLAGGALFGLVRGTLYVFVAASIGATAAFLISRHVVRDAMLRRLGNDKRFSAVDAAIAREGRKIAFLIRLSPLFPFNVTNYALGLTAVRLRDYVLACIGMLPGTILYVYYGRLIGDVANVVSGAPVERGPEYWLLLVTGLIATILATALITRAARRALRTSVETTGNDE